MALFKKLLAVQRAPSTAADAGGEDSSHSQLPPACVATVMEALLDSLCLYQEVLADQLLQYDEVVTGVQEMARLVEGTEGLQLRLLRLLSHATQIQTWTKQVSQHADTHHCTYNTSVFKQLQAHWSVGQKSACLCSVFY